MAHTLPYFSSVRITPLDCRVRLGALFPDISQGEFLALEVIYRYTLIQDKGSKICVSDLAKNMKIASSAVSRMLHTLEERGLISREVDRRDRRNTYVFLTEAGRQKHQDAVDTMDDFLKSVVNRMKEEDIRQLIVLWNELADIIDDELDSRTKGERR